MNEQYMKLTQYVNCAGALAEAIKLDMQQNNGKLSERTIKALARFDKAEKAAALLHEIMTSMDEKLN